MSLKNDYKIVILKKSFYERAKKNNLKEIMDINKYDGVKYKPRPYLFLLFKIKNIDFAIPFRSNIKHDFCFKTIPHYKKGEIISQDTIPISWSGVDYSKAVIFNNNDIEDKIAQISHIETSIISKSYRKIKSEFKKYVEDYITLKKDKKANKKKLIDYKKSTLKNYHKELNID